LLSVLCGNPVYNGVIDKYVRNYCMYMQIFGLLKVYNWVTKLNINEKMTAWVFTAPNPQVNCEVNMSVQQEGYGPFHESPKRR